MEKIKEITLNLLPSKNNSFAITLHNISKDDFYWLEKTLDYLKENFDFEDPFNILKKKDISKGKRKIILTFDDAFKSNLLVAEKILKPRNIKALFFITFGFVGLKGNKAIEFVKKNYYPSGYEKKFDENLDALNLNDITSLILEGHRIGAHTKNHPDFKNLSYKDLENEIILSTNEFEYKIGNPINCFAYPFGSPRFITKESLYLVKERFDLAFTNIRGGLYENPNKYLLFRQNISPGCPLWKIKAIINGQLDLAHYKKRSILKNRF